MIKKEIEGYSEESKKRDVEEILIENFVSLQKVLTNLSIKFDSLSNQISKLLQLFEISAKDLVENNNGKMDSADNSEVVERLDALLDQNKTIAKGLTLMEEQLRTPKQGAY